MNSELSTIGIIQIFLKIEQIDYDFALAKKSLANNTKFPCMCFSVYQRSTNFNMLLNKFEMPLLNITLRLIIKSHVLHMSGRN